MTHTLFALLCLPWTFLGLYGDIGWNTILLYPAAIALPWLLGRCLKTCECILPGNLANLIASLLAYFASRTEQWNGYFTVLGGLGSLLALWLLALLPQSIFLLHRNAPYAKTLLGCNAVLLLLIPLLSPFLAML